ncbi:MAG: hypothetical protein GF346_09585 [Candidatus Eisenbacteria bacterium]|nr:hypothetical protein [Candidatus Latescibacterota bacterium]MBD3302684.1 hypothetical protein [Candidatus Eisenbacteria bacterium]
MSGGDPRLEALRLRLERTEADLRERGYRTERCVAHPGSRMANQILSQETLVLLLYGRVSIESGGERVELRGGGRMHVPSGVPYVLTVEGEEAAYWLQGRRAERPGSAESKAEGKEADR